MCGEEQAAAMRPSLNVVRSVAGSYLVSDSDGGEGGGSVACATTWMEAWPVDEVVFGRYRLLSVIGEGGMGRVYKAHDTVIGRDVAIKVLPTELASEPGYEERFRREAHTAARLTEPHIIPIYDTGEIEGRLYR